MILKAFFQSNLFKSSLINEIVTLKWRLFQECHSNNLFPSVIKEDCSIVCMWKVLTCTPKLHLTCYSWWLSIQKEYLLDTVHVSSLHRLLKLNSSSEIHWFWEKNYLNLAECMLSCGIFSGFVTVFTTVRNAANCICVVTGVYGNPVCVNKNNCSSPFQCLVGIQISWRVHKQCILKIIPEEI